MHGAARQQQQHMEQLVLQFLLVHGASGVAFVEAHGVQEHQLQAAHELVGDEHRDLASARKKRLADVLNGGGATGLQKEAGR